MTDGARHGLSDDEKSPPQCSARGGIACSDGLAARHIDLNEELNPPRTAHSFDTLGLQLPFPRCWHRYVFLSAENGDYRVMEKRAAQGRPRRLWIVPVDLTQNTRAPLRPGLPVQAGGGRQKLRASPTQRRKPAAPLPATGRRRTPVPRLLLSYRSGKGCARTKNKFVVFLNCSQAPHFFPLGFSQGLGL